MLIQGMTLAGVMFDEVALMPRSFVEQACARCSVPGSKYWFNCNPHSPEHWFYKEWVKNHKKKNALRLHFTMDDNLALDPKIKARYESMYTGVFYQRYIKGLWVLAEGIIYQAFNKETSVVPTEPRPYSKYIVSMDYGIQNPTAMLLFGLCDGIWYPGRTSSTTADVTRDGRRRTRNTTTTYASWWATCPCESSS